MEFLDDDTDLGTGIGSTLPASTVTDEDDIWDTPPAADDAPPRSASVAELLDKPIGQILSAIALQGVPTKMKKKPLASMSNEWLTTAFARIYGLQLANPTSPDAADWRMDIALLQAAADARSLDFATPAANTAGDVGAGAEEQAPSGKSDHPHHEAGGPTVSTSPSGSIAVHAIRVADIVPDPTQARDEGADDELAASIASVGVLTPIRIYEHPDGSPRYVIEDGERRYRGSIKAGIERIPAIIVNAPESEGDKLLLQVSSNDGKRLKPMEEARTFKRIMADKGWNLQQLATNLGKSKSTVSDRLAIVDIPSEFVKYFEEGLLSAAAAPVLRPLSSLPDKARQRVIDAFLGDWNWEDALREARDKGKPVPVTGYNGVEDLLQDTLETELREIDPKAGADYKGKVVTVGKTEYALDVAAYDAAKKQAEANPSKKKAPLTAAELKVRAEDKKRQERDRAARAKETAAREKAVALRRAQFAAVAAKMPTSVDAKFALLLIGAIVDAVQFDLNESAFTALNIPAMPNKGGAFNAEYRRIMKHAESLDLKGRTRLLLQLAAWAGDRKPYNKSDDRLEAAAQILRIDLKKVKVPDVTEFAAKAKGVETGYRAPGSKKKARR